MPHHKWRSCKINKRARQTYVLGRQAPMVRGDRDASSHGCQESPLTRVTPPYAIHTEDTHCLLPRKQKNIGIAKCLTCHIANGAAAKKKGPQYICGAQLTRRLHFKWTTLSRTASPFCGTLGPPAGLAVAFASQQLGQVSEGPSRSPPLGPAPQHPRPDHQPQGCKWT